MSLTTKLIEIIEAFGGDVKALRANHGNLASLQTTNKNNLVSAINEIVFLVAGQGSEINDNATSGNLQATWSASKIIDIINQAKLEVTDSLLNGAGPALDTLSEFANALNNDPSFATSIANQLALRLRFDAPQLLTQPQQAQARSNISAVSFEQLQAVVDTIGDTTIDFVSLYNAAKA